MRNWGGTQEYAAPAITYPTSIDELTSIVTGARQLRVVGTLHTFSRISDATTMVHLGGLGERFELDLETMTVTVDGAMTFARLAELLAPHGLAVRNLASLTRLSIAGAISTATHGSGDEHGCLSTAVVAVEIMSGRSEVVRLRRGDTDFDGIVVALGAAGAVLSVTLAVVPAFEVRQDVWLGISLAEVADDLDAVFAAGDSVSVFTRWAGAADQVWVKQRMRGDAGGAEPLPGARPATTQLHPVPGSDPEACTPQLGIAGPWSARLPHFPPNATPSAGHEIQSEFFVPRSAGPAAIAALDRVGDRLDSVLMTSELRTIAADTLWLSPFHERASVGFHFTWRPDPPAVAEAVGLVEQALRPHEQRPHWGKCFTPGTSLEHPTARRADAVELFRTFDPDGVFANEWLRAERLR